MEKLHKSDIIQASKIFALSMFNDNLHVWFFPDIKTRLKKLDFLYQFKLKSQLKLSYKVSSKLEGLCIWESPDDHHSAITIFDLIYGFSLVFRVGIISLYKMIKYQIWSTKLRNNLNVNRYWYLDVVVVSPEYQGKGFASKMIKPFLENANNLSEAVYLETQNLNNVPIYEKYGFKLLASQKFDNTGIIQYCMIKQ